LLDDLSISRRTLLRLGAFSTLSLLLPFEARGDEPAPLAGPGAVIVLWLSGGPSQRDTFDPKPGTRWSGPIRAIETRAPGIEIAHTYPQLADVMHEVALVRSVTTPEGEHERGTYLLRTGYRPVPTVVHPSLGAVTAKELADPSLDIPAHVAIEPQSFGVPRGGLLGASYDAFATGDPKNPLPDVAPRVPLARLDERAADLAVVDRAFADGRAGRAEATGHAQLAARARATMTSPRLKAFDIKEEPKELIARYGDTPFGRGCLAARRLVQVGVRAVEVSLGGWDSHTGNFEAHKKNAAILDPAIATLLRDLREKDLLRTTLVLCMGEFGRTPAINRLEGRDHWARGFSVLLAGRGIRGGALVGETDASGEKAPTEPVSPGDLFATIYKTLGLDPGKQNVSAIGRPIKLADGAPVAKLLA
jgi:uncharacterized protein (DUF1501 family)